MLGLPPSPPVRLSLVSRGPWKMLVSQDTAFGVQIERFGASDMVQDFVCVLAAGGGVCGVRGSGVYVWACAVWWKWGWGVDGHICVKRMCMHRTLGGYA